MLQGAIGLAPLNPATLHTQISQWLAAKHGLEPPSLSWIHQQNGIMASYSIFNSFTQKVSAVRWDLEVQIVPRHKSYFDGVGEVDLFTIAHNNVCHICAIPTKQASAPPNPNNIHRRKRTSQHISDQRQ